MLTNISELEILQEYSDNRGVALVVDRDRGVIPGVKLVGTVSKKGREYPKDVLAKAIPLYEGTRVNVDHVDPGARRSLRDRIGLIKNVVLHEDGLYGDFHFNPKHPLAEQVAWDAENAPQNLGFSHDTRGMSRNRGGRVIVESIEEVLSVDLVANPATTAGLFEDSANDRPSEPEAVSIFDLTLDRLRRDRPDLLVAMQESIDGGSELKRLLEEVTALRAERSARELREAIDGELKEAGLDPGNRTHCSEVFLEDLRSTVDPVRRKLKIRDRQGLLSAAKATAGVPITGSAAMQEGGDSAPPATAPLNERVRRFIRDNRGLSTQY